jgi:hypothetical protein
MTTLLDSSGFRIYSFLFILTVRVDFSAILNGFLFKKVPKFKTSTVFVQNNSVTRYTSTKHVVVYSIEKLLKIAKK